MAEHITADSVACGTITATFTSFAARGLRSAYHWALAGVLDDFSFDYQSDLYFKRTLNFLDAVAFLFYDSVSSICVENRY